VQTSSTIDRYQTGNSQIHQLDPRIKLVFAISFILSNVLLPDGAWLSFGLSWMIVLAITNLAQVKFGFVFKRSLIALPFALAAITLMFTLPGEPLTSFQLGSWTLTISDAGLIRFLSILARSWLSVQMAILLTATTKFPDLAHGLRHLGLPLILIAIISFMYRYLFVLVEEAGRLLRAREARSAASVTGKSPSVFWRARVAGNMVGQLFLRSYERSDRVYNAMVVRGFRGEFLTFTPHRLDLTDWTVLVSGLLLLVFLQIISNLI
jgi:cobalt/nickel transport system permease protein